MRQYDSHTRNAIKIVDVDSEIYHTTYHQMNRDSTEEGMYTSSFNTLQRENYYMMIMFFTKLDIIIKSMTRNEYEVNKYHLEVGRYLPPKTSLILEEGIKGRFSIKSADIAK